VKRSEGTSTRAIPAMERVGTVGAVACFSLALSVVSVAVPIQIIEAGYSLAEVGFFIALAAVAQIAVRFRIGAVMRRVADKYLVGVAAVLMAGGTGLLVVSATIWAIVASQLLQGAARGLFWTGVQTHAVRTSSKAARGLASVNLASGVGLILGPLLAGVLLESSARSAVGAAAVGAAAGLLPVALMARLPVFAAVEEHESEGRVSRRAGVRAGSWAGASAGAWRGLLGAYVPVALHQAGHASTVIGTVVALANAATIVAGWAGGWVRSGRFAVALASGILATGLGLALFGVTTELVAVAGVALAVSGVGMGVLQTVGPAAAAESVGEQERGEAIAAVGLYRAGATFAAPAGVAALVLAMPLGWALAAAGLLLALPATYVVRVRAAVAGSLR
jgi:MFS family permease